jgi:hypothetical protein
MHTYKVQEGVMAQGSCLSEQLPLRALWQVRLVLHKGAYQAASSFRLRLQELSLLGRESYYTAKPLSLGREIL